MKYARGPRHLPRGAFVLVLGAVSVYLVGCHGDPYDASYTRSQPKASSLVGTYVLTEQTLNEQPVTALRSKAGALASPITLVLRADGSFVATNIPQWSEGVPGEWWIKSFKSGSGKWELGGNGAADGSWGIVFSSTNIKLPNIDGMGTFLLGEKAPYPILLNLAVDPDQDEAMTFEKPKP